MADKKYTRKELLFAIYQKYSTLDDLARALNTTKQNISDKIGRQTPKFIAELESLGIIMPGNLGEKHIGIDIGGGSTDVSLFSNQKATSNVVPVQGYFYKVIMSINAGDPAEIYREENYTGEEVFFPYEKSDRCFALKVVGDSMLSDNGRSISEGDFVIADMDAEILNGDIVVIHLANGRQMVKQYISGPEDSIVLRSSNASYPDIIIKESDVQAMMRVVGKALYKRF